MFGDDQEESEQEDDDDDDLSGNDIVSSLTSVHVGVKYQELADEARQEGHD